MSRQRRMPLARGAVWFPPLQAGSSLMALRLAPIPTTAPAGGAGGGRRQERVRLLRVERGVRRVGDREVLDDVGALQREIADPVLLVRRLVRAMGEGDGRVEQ